MIGMGFFIVCLCFCCGFRHCEQPQCLRDRKHRKKTKRREKAKRKREKRLEEEEMIKERRRRKAMMRHMKHREKLAKKIMSNHWSTRKITEERKKEILGE